MTNPKWVRMTPIWVHVAAICVLVLLAVPAWAVSPWQAASFGVGGQGLWADEGVAPSFKDAEAIGRASVSLTPHISVVGGVSYGVSGSYLRGSAGARLTATDVNDPDFSIGIGVSRHWVSESGRTMDEAAAEAGIGWRPIQSSKFIVTALASYGFDSGRRMISAGILFPFKLASGGSQ